MNQNLSDVYLLPYNFVYKGYLKYNEIKENKEEVSGVNEEKEMCSDNYNLGLNKDSFILFLLNQHKKTLISSLYRSFTEEIILGTSEEIISKFSKILLNNSYLKYKKFFDVFALLLSKYTTKNRKIIYLPSDYKKILIEGIEIVAKSENFLENFRENNGECESVDEIICVGLNNMECESGGRIGKYYSYGDEDECCENEEEQIEGKRNVEEANGLK